MSCRRSMRCNPTGPPKSSCVRQVLQIDRGIGWEAPPLSVAAVAAGRVVGMGL
jgi:hypothetical protein